MKGKFQHKIEEVGQLVIAEFSSEPVVEHFVEAAQAGLWSSEQTLITRYFQQGARVLDLGCGAGRTSLPLTRAGFDVVGVDISPQMIAAARRLASNESLPVRFEVGNAVQLQFPDSSFDYVIFSNQGWTQIPGAENRLTALREIRRVLLEGGYFLFSTHTRPCAIISPTWGWRWVRWHARMALHANSEGIDFGDLLFIRSLPVAHSMKQYVHIPTQGQVRRLLHSQSFQLLETMREHSVRHDPLVYLARLDSRGA